MADNSVADELIPSNNRNLIIGVVAFWAVVIVAVLAAFIINSGKNAPLTADNTSLSTTDPKLQNEIQPLIDKLNTDPNDVSSLLRIADIYLREQRPDKAKPALERALVVDPNSVDGLVMMGEVYSDFGQINEARAQFDKALSIKPNDGYAMNAKAVFLANMEKNYQGAKELLEKALKANPDGQPAASLKKNLDEVNKILQMGVGGQPK